jgi:hypothetical protein
LSCWLGFQDPQREAEHTSWSGTVLPRGEGIKALTKGQQEENGTREVRLLGDDAMTRKCKWVIF